MLAKTVILHYELGTAYGKYTYCALLAVNDPGDSDIIGSMLEQTGKK